MSSEKVLNISPIRGVPWQTFDPFLFCVYHQDPYPPAMNVSARPHHSQDATSAWILKVRTAGGCITAAWSPDSLSTRTADSRP